MREAGFVESPGAVPYRAAAVRAHTEGGANPDQCVLFVWQLPVASSEQQRGSDSDGQPSTSEQ